MVNFLAASLRIGSAFIIPKSTESVNITAKMNITIQARRFRKLFSKIVNMEGGGGPFGGT